MARDLRQPVLAGVVLGLVGFLSSFAIVVEGLRSVGASGDQAASGLLVLSVAMGGLGVVLAWRTKLPLALAWSTPGAALLISAGPPPGGWPAAVGAFAFAGALTVLTGLVGPLRRAVEAVPGPIAAALLAGVLLSVCVEPARGAVERPALVVPVVVAWALLLRFARPWAVPGALVAAAVAIGVDGALDTSRLASPWPTLAITTPEVDVRALIGLGLPLFVVTMASQNLTGMSVLSLYGYRTPLREVLASTGTTSALLASLGGHGINLAAITAAMAAGPDAHPDPGRRWVAVVASGITNVLLGLTAALVTALVAASPPQGVRAVAGVALVGALAGALRSAVADDDHREAAVVAFAVTVSGIEVAGVSSPFWGLVAGLAFLALGRRGAERRERPQGSG